MRLPNLKWEWENKEQGRIMLLHGKWKVYVSSMILCWWISVVHKGEVLEIIGSDAPTLDEAISEASSLFYFHYTEQ